MTSETAPQTSEEVAQRAGDNIKTILTERGLTLEWLADEIGISVDRFLVAFAEKMPFWLILDSALFLEVRADDLIGVRA